MEIHHDPSDPLNFFLRPPPGETRQEKGLRKRRQADEKKASDIIDESIKQEDAALQEKNKNLIRVVLLGQAGSGKSTLLRNLKIRYGYEDWVRERMEWRAVIQLNLVRFVLAIIDTLQDRIESQDTASVYPLGPQPEGDAILARVPENVQILISRLEPKLRTVEQTLKRWPGTEEVGTDNAVVSELCATPFDWPMLPQAERSFVVITAKFQDIDESTPKRDQDENTEVIASCKEDMKLLYEDEYVRSVLQKRSMIPEHSVSFFLNDLDRIATLAYMPTDEDEDVIRTRVLTIEECRLRIPSAGPNFDEWIIYDVGGARTKRAAWMTFLHDVNAIIFLAPISAFDEYLSEDPSVNRIEDSIILWKSTCSSSLLAEVPLILFLTKCDILKSKLQRGIRVEKYVKSYGDRSNEFESVIEYFRSRFITINKQFSPNPPRWLSTHAINVTDMKATTIATDDVRGIILRDHLRDTRLVG